MYFDIRTALQNDRPASTGPGLILEISRLAKGTHYFRLIPPFVQGWQVWDNGNDGVLRVSRSFSYQAPINPPIDTMSGEPEKPTRILASFAWYYGSGDQEDRLVYLVFNKYSAIKQLTEASWDQEDGELRYDRRDIIVNIGDGMTKYSILLDARAQPSGVPSGVVETLDRIAAKGRVLDPSAYFRPNGKLIPFDSNGAPSPAVGYGAPAPQTQQAPAHPVPQLTPAPIVTPVTPSVVPQVSPLKNALRNLARAAGLPDAIVVQCASKYLTTEGALTRDGFESAAVDLVIRGAARMFGLESLGPSASDMAAISAGLPKVTVGIQDKIRAYDWTVPENFQVFSDEVGLPVVEAYDEIPF